MYFEWISHFTRYQFSKSAKHKKKRSRSYKLSYTFMLQRLSHALLFSISEGVQAQSVEQKKKDLTNQKTTKKTKQKIGEGIHMFWRGGGRGGKNDTSVPWCWRVTRKLVSILNIYWGAREGGGHRYSESFFFPCSLLPETVIRGPLLKHFGAGFENCIGLPRIFLGGFNYNTHSKISIDSDKLALQLCLHGTARRWKKGIIKSIGQTTSKSLD